MPEQKPGLRRWVIVGGTAAAIAMKLLGPTLLASSPGGPDHPSAWDPRVEALAGFAAAERGLEFEHPVHVEFLPTDEFAAATTASPDEAAEVGTAPDDDFVKTLRALGIARGAVDLGGAAISLSVDGTAGLYDPLTERIRIRGTDLTDAVRATLVHELTHVLQDQHFGLDTVFSTAGQRSGFRALAEGDAQRIASRWIAGLPEDRGAALADDLRRRFDDTGPAPAEAPAWLVASLAAPYALGEPFVAAVEAHRGDDGVDLAFRSPPVTEEHLLDPTRFLSDETAGYVTPPEMPSGATRLIAQGDLGALTWALMLAERIRAGEVPDAVDGWGSDSHIVYERNGQICVSARFVGDDRAETDEMAAALDRWAAAMPAGAAVTITRDLPYGTVAVVTCDPGPDAEQGGGGGSTEVLGLFATRSHLMADLLARGDAPTDAACAAGALVRQLSPTELTAGTPPPDLPERMEAARQGCSVPRQP